YDSDIAATRSSQYGMVIAMPFDFVADVSFFAGRLSARANAYFSTRSMPVRVMTVSWMTVSRSVPSNMRPPTDEYSPSVFSRTTQKSTSPGSRPASGLGTPLSSLTGRRFTYWSNTRRNWRSDPHRLTWSGTTSGQPTAPKKIASTLSSLLAQSSGIITPCAFQYSALAQSSSTRSSSKP